ncbi:MAG: VPLPA-CTERM sorting domain-containing protein [Sneathiella sp.]|uniref:VPLPA-CTERM sorting domain-containing protein n=1 Tax=Sneathiella sp. TaxID=1964365 RepID=UPI003003A047
MKSLLKTMAVATVLVLTAATAQAATTTYNLGGNGADALSMSFGDLTVTAGYNPIPGSPANVTQTTGGLGVNNHHIDDDRADGRFRDDVLYLSFGSAVDLISATFTSISGDRFSFWADVDGDGLENGEKFGTHLDPSGSTYTFTGSLLKNAALFGLEAELSGSDWRLQSITVSAVPIPAALPLFGAALIGMGFLARRRKQKASLQA